MSKPSGAQGKIISATAGLTVLLTLFMPSLFNIELNVVSIISPILAAVVVIIGDWLIAHFGIESARYKRIDSNSQKRIDDLRKNIKEHTESGIDTSVLEAELHKAIISQSKLQEAFNKDF